MPEVPGAGVAWEAPAVLAPWPVQTESAEAETEDLVGKAAVAAGVPVVLEGRVSACTSIPRHLC